MREPVSRASDMPGDRTLLARAVMATLALFVTACGDDVGTAATDGGLRDGASAEPIGIGKDACYAAARASDAGLDGEAKCVCDNCLDEITACNQDEACSEIRECMQRTDCGATSCYFGKGLCRKVIDRWGMMSLSFAMAQRIGECSSAMGCPADKPAACTLGSFACDGHEDCTGGKRCCTRWNGAAYDESRCAASCEDMGSIDAGLGGIVWYEMCHPGESCTAEGYSCLATSFLPSFLYRCRDTGEAPGDAGSTAASEVNCGAMTCGDGEKCCVRGAKDPYCAPRGEACACEPSSAAKDAAVSDDAGGDAG